ncbi:MAG TPA: hypothetical protein VLA25_07225, partial [Methylotenera sp.]|nr:hypothetical protein [Methylotenera sp.]
MHIKKSVLHILCSLVCMLVLCKQALADEPSNFWDGFNLGGYSSGGITLPREDDAEAAINEISLLLTWNGDSRWSFFSELELED